MRHLPLPCCRGSGPTIWVVDETPHYTAATALTVLATASAVTAVIFRSTITWRIIGGVTLLALILVGPLLWVCYDMAF